MSIFFQGGARQQEVVVLVVVVVDSCVLLTRNPIPLSVFFWACDILHIFRQDPNNYSAVKYYVYAAKYWIKSLRDKPRSSGVGVHALLWCPVVFSLVWVLMKVLIYAENGIDCYLPLCVSTIC